MCKNRYSCICRVGLLFLSTSYAPTGRALVGVRGEISTAVKIGNLKAGCWMKHTIMISPRAVDQINEALSRGKDVQIAVRNKKLIIWEMSNKKVYEVAVSDTV